MLLLDELHLCCNLQLHPHQHILLKLHHLQYYIIILHHQYLLMIKVLVLECMVWMANHGLFHQLHHRHRLHLEYQNHLELDHYMLNQYHYHFRNYHLNLNLEIGHMLLFLQEILVLDDLQFGHLHQFEYMMPDDFLVHHLNHQ